MIFHSDNQVRLEEVNSGRGQGLEEFKVLKRLRSVIGQRLEEVKIWKRIRS